MDSKPSQPVSGSDATPAAAPADGPTERELDLLAGLNDAQVEAVTHAGGALLILAGAGSGKTRVITRRVAWLATEREIHPDRILAITFTNKAAGEMRERVQQLIPTRGSWIRTFHSLCARILRAEIEVLGAYTRDFSIYDTTDRNQLLKQLIKRAEFDPQRFKPGMIGAWISNQKNQYSTDLGDDWTQEPAEGAGIEDEVFTRIARDYEEAMREANALDFDDLLLKVVEIFELHHGVRDAYAERFRAVLVDEYQDTNRVQYRLMRHLAGAHGNLTVCGDPDQSIYAWRGADVRNILDFEQDFPGARVVRLEQNYRSTKNILAAAQAVIRNNVERKEKDLWSEKEDGALIVSLECADEEDEAIEISRQLRAWKDAGLDWGAMGIFYRVNSMQRAVERALRLARIPYQIIAGTEFYQRREIKDLIAYLRLVVNPADNEAARRVVNVPNRGVGEKSQRLIQSFADDRRISWLQAAASSELQASLRGKAKAGVIAFSALLARWVELREASSLEALETVVEEIEYYGFLDSSGGREDVDRAANVDELRSHAANYDAMSGGGLRGFLQDIALVSDVDAYADEETKVSLMTLHAAKGLEFPGVCIIGVEEELLPHSRALTEGPDPEKGIEEERRLLYVGMTRAQERLILTHARFRRIFGQDMPCLPSRFLEELPPERVEGMEAGGSEADVLGEYEPESPDAALRVGEVVDHAHFGRGRVLQLVGSGVNARATVEFQQHGQKQLLLAYARLVRVGAPSTS